MGTRHYYNILSQMNLFVPTEFVIIGQPGEAG